MRPLVIVVDRRSDFPWPVADRLVVPAKEFVGEAARRLPAARVINLCRDLSYLSLGYYCSLLAEARGQKVNPRSKSSTALETAAAHRPSGSTCCADLPGPARATAVFGDDLFRASDDPRQR
jgi:hypothetical protein